MFTTEDFPREISWNIKSLIKFRKHQFFHGFSRFQGIILRSFGFFNYVLETLSHTFEQKINLIFWVDKQNSMILIYIF